MAKSSKHRWSFIRVGGVDQVVFKNGDDIAHLAELDQKLWSALAMPKKGAGVLPETLEALDHDGDGRIRVPDILEAVALASKNLSSLNVFFSEGETLPLDLLKNPELRAASEHALAQACKEGSRELSLADSGLALDKFAQNRFNGDGVLPPQSAGTETLAAAVTDIVAAGYCRPDLSGADGIAAEDFEKFYADAQAWLAWKAAGVIPAIAAGDALWSEYDAVRAKIDDWFARARLSALAPPESAANAQKEKLDLIFASCIDPESDELRALPIAPISAAATLDFDAAFNPAWEKPLRAFWRVAPGLADARCLTWESWEVIKEKMKPCALWREEEPVVGAGSLGAARLAELTSDKCRGELATLIAKDSAVASLRDNLTLLRTLGLLRRDFLRVLRNFVSFSDFYLHKNAMFQAGRLYLDSRECELCIEVDRPDAHKTLAHLSNACLVYCSCTNKAGAKKEILAAFTAGDSDFLIAGRNGIFYDLECRDWDAVITKIISQPISIRQAFFAPYKWVARSLSDLAQKRASNAEAAMQSEVVSKVEAASVDGAASVANAKPAPKKIDIGTVAAIGVALGGIGAMVTGIMSTFLGLGLWMPLGILAVLILVSTPSMILSYMKLRTRSLGPILDAEGWAINSRLKINVPFGTSLTHLATLPPGSERKLQDPFAEKKRPWWLYILITIALAAVGLWLFGVLDRFLPAQACFRTLIGK